MVAVAGPAMKFNPGFLSDQELVDSFCVRVPEFEMLLQTLRESTDSSNPHQLVVGPRGSGKTTLLLRVVVEVKRDPELRRDWLPVIFPEESYEIATCGEFWMQCLMHLANQSPQGGGGIDLARTLAEVRSEQDDQRLAARCLAAVLDFAAQEDRRLLLIVENLNMLFDDINDPDVGWQLRHTLQNEKRIFLLASATSRFDEVERYGRAMYDLLNVQELQRLDTDACAVLWKAVSHRDPDKGVIRSLEILTGGNPRLLAIIARFGAMLSLRELMDNLLTLVDDHTEYFKSHLDALGVQERRVYLALARLWMPATAREVAEHARLPTNNCSALLGRLVDRGAVLVAGGGPRRKQYYVAERMYNIYYLLRISRGSDRLVEALVRFMRSYYSQSDLEDYLDSLRRDSDSVDPIFLRQFGQALERADPYVEFGLAGSRELRELAARADELLRSRDWGQLVRVCEEIESNVPSDASLSESEFLADSRNLRVTALIALDHLAEAESLCSATWSEYSGSEFAPLRKAAAIAGAKRIELLALAGQSSETILEASEGFLGRFGRDSSLGIAEPQAAALFRKAAALGSLGRVDEALAAHEELIERFERDTSPAVESCVISALHAKGLLLDRSGQFDKALAAYDSAIDRFGDSGSSETVGLVARVVASKGVSLCRSNQLQDALLCFDDAINRFATCTSGEEVDASARVRFNRAVALNELGEHQRALDEFDQVARTLESHDSPFLIEVAAHALVRKGVLLSYLNHAKEARATFDCLINRYSENQTPEVASVVFSARLERAKLDLLEGRAESALDTINGALVNSGAIDGEGRLFAFLLRAEAEFECGRRDACELELVAALGLLPELPEVPRFAIKALFAFTIRLGPKPVLDLIEGSTSRDPLHPFAVALRQELGITAPAATEVLEVAKDIRTKLDEMRREGVH